MVDGQMIEQLKLDVAEIKAAQIYFREEMNRIEQSLAASSREIYQASIALERATVSLAGGAQRMDRIEKQCEDNHKDITSVQSEHGRRIDSLESTRDKQSGAAKRTVAIGGAAGMLGAGLAWLIDHAPKFLDR